MDQRTQQENKQAKRQITKQTKSTNYERNNYININGQGEITK